MEENDNIKIIFQGKTKSCLPSGRGHAKKASMVIALVRRANGEIAVGVGILYPDLTHFFFAEETSRNAETLLRGIYAASKMMYVCDTAVALAVLIAGETPLDDVRFNNAHKYISYDYGHSAHNLRAKTMAKEIPLNDIKKVVAGCKLWGVPIDDPFEKKNIKKETSPSGMFQNFNIGMESLSLVA